MKEDRRQRPRDIPLQCELRLCQFDGITCPICKRPVFRAEFVIERGGL